MAYSRPVTEELQQIDQKTWILGGRLLVSLSPTEPSSGTFWESGDGSFFSMDMIEAPALDKGAAEPSRPVSPVSYGRTIHAVWKLGEAYVKDMALKNLQRSFGIPEVLFHGEWNGRYVLITRKVRGQTTSQAWPTPGEDVKTLCVAQMARVCKEISTMFGPGCAIGGIDGGQLSERYFESQSERTWDFNVSLMQQNCAKAGLDTSELVFYHCDLTSGNVLIDFDSNGRLEIGIIDWECTGFVPADWIRTKVIVGPAFDFEFSGDNLEQERRDWRERSQSGLKDEGFRDVSENFWRLWSKQ